MEQSEAPNSMKANPPRDPTTPAQGLMRGAGVVEGRLLHHSGRLLHHSSRMPGILPTHRARAFGEAFGVGSDNYDEFRLGEKGLNDLSRNVGKPVVTTIEPISQPFVVDAHQMQDSGV